MVLRLCLLPVLCSLLQMVTPLFLDYPFASCVDQLARNQELLSWRYALLPDFDRLIGVADLDLLLGRLIFVCFELVEIRSNDRALWVEHRGVIPLKRVVLYLFCKQLAELLQVGPAFLICWFLACLDAGNLFVQEI